MNEPAVSVILPAYNCEKYIAQAIESVLQQTFTDLELIIINDGCTDKTESVILSFTDPRIIYLKNEINRGLIFTLNKAIDITRGKYIARMDADDISIPIRLQMQKDFLDQHSETGLVASTVEFIDNNNRPGEYWELDKKTLTSSLIKQVMAKESCIAHPSVMGRSEIFQKYRYKDYQKNIEDFDLWLRLLNDGIIISKIETPLLLYRLHEHSVTKADQKTKNVFFKVAKCKYKFMVREIGKMNVSFFLLKVFLYMILDVFKGIGKAIKKTVVGRK